MSSTSRGARTSKRGRSGASRRIKIVPDRRNTIDARKLARALLHLAQAEYDAKYDDASKDGRLAPSPHTTDPPTNEE